MPDDSPRLLLLSNSRDASGRYLHHARRDLREFLGDAVRTVLFVPWAGVTISSAAYAERVREPFAALGYRLVNIDEAGDPVAAVRSAEAIAVGGGNTFHLLRALYINCVIEPIRERVAAGLPYIGWSAGSVVAGPTISTTNDMPIVEPPSLAALALVPFHINAHYTDFHPPDHQGETRAERLTEFLAANPAERVVALREGAMIRVEGSNATRLGDTGALLFEREREAAEWSGEPIRRASA